MPQRIGCRQVRAIVSGAAVLFGLFCVTPSLQRASAKESLNTEDMVISSTLKTLAKIYVSGLDKAQFAAKIESMDEEKFQRQYARVYTLIKDNPAITAQYGLGPEMTRQVAAQKVKEWDKKKMYEIIDAVPDSVIAGQFRGYMSRRQQGIQGGNILAQLNQVWSKLMESTGIK